MNAVFFKHAGNDLRHRALLKDPLVGAMAQVRQVRHQRQAVAGQALARLALFNAINLPVNPVAMAVERQKCLLVQHAFKVKIGAFADKLDRDCKGGTDRLLSMKLEHAQVMLKPLDGERKLRFVGWTEHS